MTALNKQALRDSALDMIRVLGYIASFESEDIDGDDLELRFETEDGFDTGCTISITSQCQDASDVMQQLLNELEAAEKRIAELEAREIKPVKGEVLVTVSGFTGCGKSAIAGEIEIAMKAIGVSVIWSNGDAEKRMTGADWLTAIEMYKPSVRIVEVNVPRAAGIGVKGE
ncbi:TPA: ead/Ea22-like family protein [Escherichia coli]